MRTNTFFSLFWILVIFIMSCTSVNPTKVADSCIIFKEKKFWYKDSRKSYDKWDVPISLQLAIINQESSFKQYAKPERKKLLGILPWKRESSAFGYAQVVDPTWQWYKDSTGNTNASRANFADITDFIGWYVSKTSKMLGIPKNDAYNQYLAYHEGQNGWKKKSYQNKNWLLKAAYNVKENNDKYNLQLKNCEKEFNKKGLFGFL